MTLRASGVGSGGMSEHVWRKERWLPPALWLRGAVFSLVATLGLLDSGWQTTLLWCALLGLASAPSIVAPEHPIAGRIGRSAEVVVVAAAVAPWGGLEAWMLPYLVVPLSTAALFGGLPDTRTDAGVVARHPGSAEAALLWAVSAAGLTVASVEVANRSFAAAVVAALCFGALAASVGHVVRRLHAEVPASARPYAEATALLTQLRAVARKLPGDTLDPGGIATHVLEQLGGVAPADRAAVLVAGGGSRLVVLAQSAAQRVDWETELSANAVLADSWAGQQPHTSTVSLSRSGTGVVSALAVPLIADRRTVGLTVLESDQPDGYPPEIVEAVTSSVAGAALRLETALLFDEVRSLATNEERQRLAREIHDGIAQELAMLGYGIDHAMAQLPATAEDSNTQLRELRDEVTRLVTELRLSLFELRSDVDPHGGLTTAIADYARTVGASAGLRVHLSLDEGGARLPVSTETELLRIAQEAMTNARKHSRAENLWVTCEVDPPNARIEVADDGSGLSSNGNDSRYGLTIMSERAERIRGALEIRPRHPHGTVVAVVLAPQTGPGTVASETERER